MTQKKLYRSETNKIISGILGGLGEYLDIDPTIVRLVFVLLTIITGGVPGLIFYIIALVIIPRHQNFNIHKVYNVEKDNKETDSKTDKAVKNDDHATENKIAKEN